MLANEKKSSRRLDEVCRDVVAAERKSMEEVNGQAGEKDVEFGGRKNSD